MLITQIFTSNQIDEAVESIKKGELIAFPTETVYGLGADATNEEAVKKVYLAKGRPSDNPLIVHVSNPSEVDAYVTFVPQVATKLMNAFWPGPLTLIFEMKQGAFSQIVTGGMDTIAMRMPNHELTLALIKEAGVPLVGPSANTSGKPSPTTAQHVYHDLYGKIAGILEGGSTGVGLESTVVDVSNPEKPMILRPGAISKSAIENIIGPVLEDSHLASPEEKPKAPGMKYQHYAPNVPVTLVKEADWQAAITFYQEKGEKLGMLATQEIIEAYENHQITTYCLGEQGDLLEVARHLYDGLRYFDETDATLVLAESFQKEDMGHAIMNRLEKAAGYHYFKA